MTFPGEEQKKRESLQIRGATLLLLMQLLSINTRGQGFRLALGSTEGKTSKFLEQYPWLNEEHKDKSFLLTEDMAVTLKEIVRLIFSRKEKLESGGIKKFKVNKEWWAAFLNGVEELVKQDPEFFENFKEEEEMRLRKEAVEGELVSLREALNNLKNATSGATEAIDEARTTKRKTVRKKVRIADERISNATEEIASAEAMIKELEKELNEKGPSKQGVGIVDKKENVDEKVEEIGRERLREIDKGRFASLISGAKAKVEAVKTATEEVRDAKQEVKKELREKRFFLFRLVFWLFPFLKSADLWDTESLRSDLSDRELGRDGPPEGGSLPQFNSTGIMEILGATQPPRQEEALSARTEKAEWSLRKFSFFHFMKSKKRVGERSPVGTPSTPSYHR